MNTLLLDRDTWDLCVDANGNIAMASDPYSLVQDASSAVRAFQGEVWFDNTQGVPYFQEVLGLFPPASLIKELVVQEVVNRVPGVASAKCFLSQLDQSTRALTGQVQVTSAAGKTVSTSFAITVPATQTAPSKGPGVVIYNATLSS